MIWIVSWRNVWRNKLRSGVVISAITMGVFAGVFTMAFYRGMANQRIKSAIKTEVSHIQIHKPEFMKVDELDLFIDSADAITEFILQQPEVVGASKRILANAIINSAEKGSGITLVGIVPVDESMVSDIKNRLVEGEYLEEIKRGRPVVIGNRLSEKLGLKIGSKLVVGLLDLHGQPVYNQFRVGGIYKTASNVYDETTVFIKYEDLIMMLGLPESSAHEIAIYLGTTENSAPLASTLKKEFPDLNISQWHPDYA
jgi:putative ABC transport system permease protein